LTMPPTATSYRNRLRWRTRTGGSTSMSTCWLASLELNWPTCMGWRCEMCVSASSTPCTESGCAKILKVSHKDICPDERRQRTWILSWSNRQASIVAVSGWPGAHTVERDLPPNMREMGDSTELAYSCPCIRQQRQVQCRERKNIGAPCGPALPLQSGPQLIEPLPRVPLHLEQRPACAC
jgi:hypothetical protein